MGVCVPKESQKDQKDGVEYPLDVVTGMLVGFAENMERRGTIINFIFTS